MFQRAAGTADHFHTIIRNIQSQRDECNSELWNPEPVEATEQETVDTEVADMCFGMLQSAATGDKSKVGDTVVPRSLRIQNDETKAARPTSGRDAGNNILVYWAKSKTKRPADTATCWLYIANQRIWTHSY